MRIVDVRECSIPVSRYADPRIPSGGLTTSLTAIVTDAERGGKPVIGYGFGSVGRFAQGGLIRERFAPRILEAPDGAFADDEGVNIDPFKAWAAMMSGEKPGGHGERCVAVGALDMAIWDAAAKIAEEPLHRFLARRLGYEIRTSPSVRVYAGGGYRYPQDDLRKLSEEIRSFTERGFTRAKIKIGGPDLDNDLRRIEAAARHLPDSTHLAVDAMNSYDLAAGLAAASELRRYGLWWLEEVCDPLDFECQAEIADAYGGPIAAGEALFSLAEAKLLDRYGGLDRARDVLVFDPVHCYGLPGYTSIVGLLTAKGWPRAAFWPHGAHLFALHVVAALGLGGAEVNPAAFHPFCGLADGMEIKDGEVEVPNVPGIGFELSTAVWKTLQQLFSKVF